MVNNNYNNIARRVCRKRNCRRHWFVHGHGRRVLAAREKDTTTRVL